MSRGLRGARNRLTVAEVWCRQAESALKMLETLKRTMTVHGTKWTTGTSSYYKARLTEMLAHPPRGCQPKARAFRVRLSKV